MHSRDYRLVALPQRQEMKSAPGVTCLMPDWSVRADPAALTAHLTPPPPATAQGGQAQETRWCEVRQETRCNPEPTGLSLPSWPPQTLFILRYIQVQWTLEESRKWGEKVSKAQWQGEFQATGTRGESSSSPSLRRWQDVFTTTAHM